MTDHQDQLALAAMNTEAKPSAPTASPLVR